MASKPFEITVKSVITKILNEMESNYSDSDALQTYKEITDNEFKLYLKTEARDWNNFKSSTNLLLHLKIDSKKDSLIIVENNTSTDFMLDLVQA